MKKPTASKQLLRALSVIHPILFAVFPFVFLYARNTSEISARQVVKLMLLAALGALLLWILLSLLLKNTFKAGVATTVLVILFFSYGPFYDLLAKWDIFTPRHAYLLPAILLVWGYCVYLIKIVRRDFRNTTRILNVVAVALIVVNLATIAFHEIGKPRSSSFISLDLQDTAMAGGDLSELGTMPDIYYIILDEYAHPSTMLEYYDYDNSHFINELVDEGFYVASNSRVAFSQTWKSVSSSLNMEYLPATQSMEFYYQKIADSTVAN